MAYTKFALYTCAFYLGFSILLDLVFFAVANWKGGIVILFPRVGWVIVYGLVWLASFLLSYRIVVAPVLERIQNLRH